MSETETREIEAFVREARARCESATPGPWVEHEDGTAPAWRLIISEAYEGMDICKVLPWMTHVEPNAAFIAAARSDLPRALDVIERLLATVDDLAAQVYDLTQIVVAQERVITKQSASGKTSAEASVEDDL